MRNGTLMHFYTTGMWNAGFPVTMPATTTTTMQILSSLIHKNPTGATEISHVVLEESFPTIGDWLRRYYYHCATGNNLCSCRILRMKNPHTTVVTWAFISGTAPWGWPRPLPVPLQPGEHPLDACFERDLPTTDQKSTTAMINQQTDDDGSDQIGFELQKAPT